MKSAEEIMNILEAYDLTGSFRDAGELAGCSHHTVARYVRTQEEGLLVPGGSSPRAGVIDGFLPKLEELVDRSKGRIRADVAHAKITAMGYAGSERTTRRAVARLKKAWYSGQRQVFRPWVPEPGVWAQCDFGDGPVIGGSARCCSACGWPGRGSGSCCHCWTGARRRFGRPLTCRCAGSAGAGLPADRQREDGHHQARQG